MDNIALGRKIGSILKKYRYAIAVLALGVILMLLPTGKSRQAQKTEPVPAATTAEETLDSRLEAILSQIQGAGKVQVLLSVAQGERTVYQTDGDVTGGETGSSRTDTVIVTDSQRTQSGLIQQVLPPTYLGAIIVCQGADSPAVRLAIVEAVSGITGLGADRISVLKMK